MVGKRAVKSRFILSSLATAIPPYKSGMTKKSSKSLKFNTPGWLSREAILKGAFDKYIDSKTNKKGTATVDAAFLAEIEHWRDRLARNIALRNPNLTSRELNFAVQQTIDRIIFLRICEDRGIEDYGRLRAVQNGTDIYLLATDLTPHPSPPPLS